MKTFNLKRDITTMYFEHGNNPRPKVPLDEPMKFWIT